MDTTNDENVLNMEASWLSSNKHKPQKKEDNHDYT